jgi:hypothetical protein
MTSAMAKALEVLKRYPGGATCSMVGLSLYPAKTAKCNRAREGGAVLKRLREAGLVKQGPHDSYHTRWVLKGSVKP